MPEPHLTLNTNRSVIIELTNVGGDSSWVKQNSSPAVVTNLVLEKIKSDIFNMATATTAPVKRTVTLLDKIGNFFSDLFTAIKTKFSGSFNKKTMTRKFDTIFDDLQVRLTMPHEDGFKQIPEKIQSLEKKIESVQNSEEFQNLLTCYEKADESTKHELFKTFTGRSLKPNEELPENHPLKEYLTTVKQSLDNLSNIQEAVFEARDVLVRRKELKSKSNHQNTKADVPVLKEEAHKAAVKLWENRKDKGIYDYGDDPCRGNSNGHMHEDLYQYMNALFRRLLEKPFWGMENYALDENKKEFLFESSHG